MHVAVVTFVSLRLRATSESGWNKNTFIKMHISFDNAKNRFIEYKGKKNGLNDISLLSTVKSSSLLQDGDLGKDAKDSSK